VAAASASPWPRRRADMGMQNSHARDHPGTPAVSAICDSNEKLRRPPQRAPPDDRPQPRRTPCPEHLLRSRTCRRGKAARYGEAG
jgi:hypothetical protein